MLCVYFITPLKFCSKYSDAYTLKLISLCCKELGRKLRFVGLLDFWTNFWKELATLLKEDTLERIFHKRICMLYLVVLFFCANYSIESFFRYSLQKF